MKTRVYVIAALFGASVIMTIGSTASVNAFPSHREAVNIHYEVPPRLGIPRGHLPPAGYYRIWLPGRPPGLQPAPTYRADVYRYAPPRSWVIYRPVHDRRFVYVRFIDARRFGRADVVHVYDARRGTYVRTELPVRVRYRR